MIELLLETSMRRGELLKLYTTDINKGSQHAYVSINDRENDPGDPSAEEPALRTHGRTVGISTQLYEVYEHYRTRYQERGQRVYPQSVESGHYQVMDLAISDVLVQPICS